MPNLLDILEFCGLLAGEGQTDMHVELKPGDPVIYRVSKTSTDPGPRAQQVYPAEHGDWYSYQVDKFWAVSDIQPDGTLVLVTRRGKQHTVTANDPRLRPASWWERWLYRNRFPAVGSLSSLTSASPD